MLSAGDYTCYTIPVPPKTHSIPFILRVGVYRYNTNLPACLATICQPMHHLQLLNLHLLQCCGPACVLQLLLLLLLPKGLCTGCNEELQQQVAGTANAASIQAVISQLTLSEEVRWPAGSSPSVSSSTQAYIPCHAAGCSPVLGGLQHSSLHHASQVILKHINAIAR